jgi:hypothetical protein
MQAMKILFKKYPFSVSAAFALYAPQVLILLSLSLTLLAE